MGSVSRSITRRAHAQQLQQSRTTQKMSQCVDRSAKHDFHRDGIMFIFYTGLPHVFGPLGLLYSFVFVCEHVWCMCICACVYYALVCVFVSVSKSPLFVWVYVYGCNLVFLIMQVMYNRLYKGGSNLDGGTLIQLRNLINRNVATDISGRFNKAVDFFNWWSVATLLLLQCTILG